MPADCPRRSPCRSPRRAIRQAASCARSGSVGWATPAGDGHVFGDARAVEGRASETAQGFSARPTHRAANGSPPSRRRQHRRVFLGARSSRRPTRPAKRSGRPPFSPIPQAVGFRRCQFRDIGRIITSGWPGSHRTDLPSTRSYRNSAAAGNGLVAAAILAIGVRRHPRSAPFQAVILRLTAPAERY